MLPANVPAVCTTGLPATAPGNNAAAKAHWGEADFRLAPAAYDHPKTCYDREYLFQWAEMDPKIHTAGAGASERQEMGCTAGAPGCSLEVPTEPYHPAYFLINGRSMPDLMDANYAAEYPHQPYNGNPHMHPGELTLIRIDRPGPLATSLPRARQPRAHPGAGRKPDSQRTTNSTDLAGTSDVQHRYHSRAGVRWDLLLHRQGTELGYVRSQSPDSTDPLAKLPCTPDANGYNTGSSHGGQLLRVVPGPQQAA